MNTEALQNIDRIFVTDAAFHHPLAWLSAEASQNVMRSQCRLAQALVESASDVKLWIPLGSVELSCFW